MAKGEYNRFRVIYEDSDGKTVISYRCAGSMSEDGLFTFTVPYEEELPYPAERKTYQFVYICYEDGLILTDGEKTYAYTCKAAEYHDYRLSDVLEDIAAEDLTDSQTEELLATQSGILNSLEEAFAEADVAVDIDDSTGRVTMDSSILFAYDDATLSEEGKSYLDRFLDVYSSVLTSDRYSDAVGFILVEGHTDTSGGYDYNMALSEQRAGAVVEYCLSRQPALADIIRSKGCAYDDPVYDAEGNVDMEASRRVLFKFILNVNP